MGEGQGQQPISQNPHLFFAKLGEERRETCRKEDVQLWAKPAGGVSSNCYKQEGLEVFGAPRKRSSVAGKGDGSWGKGAFL